MFNLSPPQLISRSDDARRWGQWRHLFRDQVSTVGIFLGGQPRESRGNTKRGDRDWFLMANKWCAICFTKVVVLFGAASWLVHRQWRQWHANSRAKQLDLKTSVVSIQVFGFLFSKKQFQLERRSMADVKETSSQTIVSCNCRSTHNNWTGAAVNLDHFGLIVCSVAIATSWFLPPFGCNLQVTSRSFACLSVIFTFFYCYYRYEEFVIVPSGEQRSRAECSTACTVRPLLTEVSDCGPVRSTCKLAGRKKISALNDIKRIKRFRCGLSSNGSKKKGK